MKKVFCDDRISVWQDGDKFIGETGPNDKPNLKIFLLDSTQLKKLQILQEV